ncbi:MAG: glycosyltransferase family 2 protein [Anaerolineales bacterium]|nr:glycosyltransferase family 2 protein [Anaerolineales bacterium]
MNAPFLSIVIPAYNEAKRLPNSLERIFAFLDAQDYSSEVIVVENGSADNTFQVAKQFTKEHPNLTVVQESQKGKGNAVRRGMFVARGEFRFICDADLSMPIEDLPNFLPPAIEDFDLAIASREAEGAVRYNEPPYRHVGGRAINFIVRLFILPGLHDTQCGFKCFRAETAQILFEKQTMLGWSFDIELLYLARRRKLRIREIPIHWHFDADSKVSAVRDALRMIGDIFHIHLNALRGVYGRKA